MCCVGEMVRKLRARMEVTSSNPRTRAHVYFAWKFACLVTCDVRVCEGLKDLPFGLSSSVPVGLKGPIPLTNRDWRSSLHQWYDPFHGGVSLCRPRLSCRSLSTRSPFLRSQRRTLSSTFSNLSLIRKVHGFLLEEKYKRQNMKLLQVKVEIY
jgi:hypothetical protein